MNKTTRLFIRVTDEQKARLQAACDRDGAVMSEICRRALERFVMRSEAKSAKAPAAQIPASSQENPSTGAA